MRSYEAARSLFSFLGFVAWSVIVVGALVAIVSAGGVSQYAGAGAGLLAAVPGLAISIAGFILLAFVQIGRAGVDTAEYTQQMLKLSRDQLEVSKQGLNQGKSLEKSFAALKQPEPAPVPSGYQTLEQNEPEQNPASEINPVDVPVQNPEDKTERHVESFIEAPPPEKPFELTQDHLNSIADLVVQKQAKVPEPEPVLSAAPPNIRMPKFQPFTDPDGFKVLNETATRLEYRGRQFKYSDGKFECDGRKFADADKVKKYLSQLRVPAT